MLGHARRGSGLSNAIISWGLPGRTAIVVTFPSSFAIVIARWFTAAFEAPYAPHDVYAAVAAPEDVSIRRP